MRKTPGQIEVYGGHAQGGGAVGGEAAAGRFGNTTGEPMVGGADLGPARLPDSTVAPYPRGPPMTEMSNVHSGSMMGGAPKVHVGPLSQEDERELVQLFFSMVCHEKTMEESKQLVAECGDFNLMDAF